MTYATSKKHARLHVSHDFNVFAVIADERISENVAKYINI